jgi:DNA-binding response OmpR family regulator
VRILVVEDETELADAVVEALQDDYHAVDHAADGKRADELMHVHDYDLVVLDWNIPPPTGVELLRQWRQEGYGTPVLVLTGSRTGVRDKVEGLDTGADDYLTKPFAFAELRARIRSLLRRRKERLHTDLEAGDLVMERAARAVTVNGDPLHLSPKEFGLLEYLLLHKDQVVSRRDLSEHVWDESFDPMSNVIDVLIHRLRKKVDGIRPTKLLHTVPGAGYMLKSERA